MAGRIPLVCTSLLAAVAIVHPSTARAQAAADSTSPAAINAGRALYHGSGTCQVCHGAALEGGVGPALKDHPWKDAKGGGYDAILHVIVTGVAGTTMTGRAGGISDAEARQVAAYIWAVSHGKAKA